MKTEKLNQNVLNIMKVIIKLKNGIIMKGIIKLILMIILIMVIGVGIILAQVDINIKVVVNLYKIID